MKKIGYVIIILLTLSMTFSYATPAVASPNLTKTERKEYIKLCEEYLNRISTFAASITQINSIDHSFYHGTLHIKRSHTHYDRSSMSIKYFNEQGKVFQHLLVLNEKVFLLQPFAKDPQDRTQEFPLYQTPADILLQPKIKFGADIQVKSLKFNGKQIFLTLVKEGEEEHFSLSFIFDLKPTFQLKGWTVIDPQGHQTQVALEKVQMNGALPTNAFQK